MGAQSSGLMQLIDQRNILLGNGAIFFGNPPLNLGQIKGDATFNYSLRPFDVTGGNPIVLLRRFTMEEKVTVTVPLLEVNAPNISLFLRNYASGATTVIAVASGGGSVTQQSFGGSSKMPFSVMQFKHPTPEGGYVLITGWAVYPPLELRLPFPEARETTYDATFEFRNDITRASGAQLGQFDVFVQPLIP